MPKSVAVKISAGMQNLAVDTELRLKQLSGNEDCRFITLVADNTGQVHYVANVEREASANLLYSLLVGWARRDDHVAEHVRQMILNASKLGKSSDHRAHLQSELDRLTALCERPDARPVDFHNKARAARRLASRTKGT
ncbi:MAG: hypothetical protein L3J65_01030 [Robiginitomaculum sp.]|nr:hypothetical protein [Robiginitomaculum sp.]